MPIDHFKKILKNLKLTQISRLENIQYQAAKLVTGAFHYSSREKLNKELGWESIEKRSDLLSLNIFHKIHLHETRPLIRNCMPRLDFEQEHFYRSKGGYTPFKNYGFDVKKIFLFLHIWSLEQPAKRCPM